MNTEQAPFESVAIVGLGLIGGSLALATRERWPSIRVTGVDSNEVIAHVRGSGAIDRSAQTIAEAGDVELIVLAAPVQQNRALLRGLRVRRPTIVTDVGSTKQAMGEDGRTLGEPAIFVGGHPLGGGERGGFAFARPDLFEARPWILTSDTGTPDARERLSSFVSGLGARPVVMTSEAHDRVMALVSHLPQLAASALMDVVGTAAGPEGLRLAGRGLADTTRLASSPADIWRDVCQTNADAIGGALDLLIARLVDVRQELDHGSAIDELFEQAGHWRAVLMKGPE